MPSGDAFVHHLDPAFTSRRVWGIVIKFIVPKFIHLAKVFPLPKKKLIGMQKACSKFIWRNRLERIALEQSHPNQWMAGDFLARQILFESEKQRLDVDDVQKHR